MPAAAAEPASARLGLARPYRLAGPTEQQRLLETLTAALTGLPGPVQLRHAPACCHAETTGAGAAATLTEELAATARPRITEAYGQQAVIEQLAAAAGDLLQPGAVVARQQGAATDRCADIAPSTAVEPIGARPDASEASTREAVVAARRSGCLPAGAAARNESLDGDDVESEAGAAEPRPGALSTGTAAEHPRHVDLPDGRVGRVLALESWPSVIEPDWLAGVAADLACAAISLHAVPVDAASAGPLLRRRLAALNSTEVVDERTGRLADPTTAAAAEAAAQLWEQVARGQTSLLSAQLLIAVTADDIAGLDAAGERIARLLAPTGAQVRTLTFEQTPAWQACQPGGAPTRWPWRLLDAASLAATIPHPRGRTDAGAGLLVGVEPETGCPIRCDRFGWHNPTRLVVGTSGAGKSYAAKCELMRAAAAGLPCSVVDPEGEFGQLVHTLDGLILAVGEEPVGLDPAGLACEAGLPATEALSLLATVATGLAGSELGPADLALLDRALSVLRADLAAAPSMSDLLDVISDLAAHPPFDGSDLPARLAPAVGGSLAALFAANPALADPPGLVCFDLRSVPARARPAVTACVLGWAWTRRTRSRDADPSSPDRQLLVVDEAHLLLDDPAAADLLAQFARRARKYGVALDVATQRLADFLNHPAGQAVLANAAGKLLLGCEDHDRAAIADGLGLTDAEAALLRPGQPGDGLLLTPDRRTPIRIIAADAEHALAATGPRPTGAAG
jgi:hypothetical protein